MRNSITVAFHSAIVKKYNAYYIFFLFIIVGKGDQNVEIDITRIKAHSEKMQNSSDVCSL